MLRRDIARQFAVVLSAGTMLDAQGEMSKVSTIRSVAERAGVSVATVSRVLNKRPNVSADARERVEAAIRELDFRPSLHARGMRAGSRMIGLMMGDYAPPYVVEVELGAAERCRAEGRHLVLGSFEPATQAATAVSQMIASVKLDGLILYPPIADDPAVIEVVRASRTPCARLSTFEAADVPTVRIDERRAAAAMTRHLLSLGHRRIGFITGPPEHGASALRHQGFMDALAEAGHAPAPELIAQGDFRFASGFARGGELLRLEQAPTAIFASNDDMAIGVMAAAKAAGVRIPDRLSVAGFDDVESARSVWPPLTTVRQPIRAMAEAAVDLVFAAIDGRGALGHQVLESAVVVRGSTVPFR